MPAPKVVIDTNVLVAALRSRRGASFRLLSLVGTGRFEIALSVPLLLEYEAVLRREHRGMGLDPQDVDDLLDYLCSIGHHQEIFYLWRPYLRDPKDDMILELAVGAACKFIITYNQRDFAGVERFNVAVLDSKRFLQKIGELP